MTRACPICNKPAQEATRPFCSQRCQQVDLGRWFMGSYSVAATEQEEEDLPDSENEA